MKRAEIEEMNQMARAHLRRVEQAEKRQEIESEARQPLRRSPITSSGIQYTEEGIETHPVASEEIDVPAQLPAKEAALSVRPARYRMELRLERPGAVDVFRDGTQIVRSRRVSGRAVMDVEGGRFTVKASAAILDLRMRRFEGRSEGTLVLGPFEAEGTVEAKAIGHGDWAARVASNRVYEGTLDGSGDVPSLHLTGNVWEGPPAGESLPAGRGNPIEDGWPWAVARRFESGLEPPNWASSAQAGTTTSGHEEITSAGVIRLDHSAYRYWRGVGQWTLLAGENAPSFDEVPGRWTYVWGTAEGAERAYSLKTGRRTDPTAEGTYFVKGDPSQVDITGAHAAQGHPLPESRETLAPISGRWRAEKSRHPGQVLVKLEGSGLARAIEIKTTRRKGPKGMEAASTRRIDLSKLWPPQAKDVPSPQRPEGRGIFLSHTERSPSS